MKIFWVALVAGGMAAAAHAETSEQRAKRVIDEAVAALGGQAYLTMQNRVETGRIYASYNNKVSGMATDATYTHYLQPSETKESGFPAVRIREARGRKPEDLELKKQDDVIFLGEGAGYEVTFRGARPLADTVLQQYKTGTLRNIFYILRQRLGETGLTFESKGSDFFENRPVEIVEITDAENNTVTVFFDQLNKLPLRQLYYQKDPIDNSKQEEVSIFNKYRDVGGGVMWPFATQRQRNGEKIRETYLEKVEINQDLKDSLFAMPTGLKLLPKDK